jgi:hypothetical protein
MCASNDKTRYFRKNLGKPSGKLVAWQVTFRDLQPHVLGGGECGSCVADTCPLAHRPQPRAHTSFCRHSNVMRLVTSQKQSTSFDHIHDCLLRFLTQMTPVLNGCGATITSNPNPHIFFFIGQSCTRQAENSRSKQNDALGCCVTVLGVTRHQGCWFLLPDSLVPCTTVLCSTCSKLGNQCRHSNFGTKCDENYKIVFQSCKISSSHKRHNPSMSAPFLPPHIPYVLLCH